MTAVMSRYLGRVLQLQPLKWPLSSRGPPAGATAPPCGRAWAPRLRPGKIIGARGAETLHHPAGDKHQLVTFVVGIPHGWGVFLLTIKYKLICRLKHSDVDSAVAMVTGSNQQRCVCVCLVLLFSCQRAEFECDLPIWLGHICFTLL